MVGAQADPIRFTCTVTKVSGLHGAHDGSVLVTSLCANQVPDIYEYAIYNMCYCIS